MRVVFSDRAYSAILAETAEKIKTETGGLFLGAIQDDTFYIIETIDPGPNSIFEIAYFEYDQKYTQHLINKIANLYSEKLSLIGLWHRHPGSFDQFSSTDNGTNAKYASMHNEGAISALVNIDPHFRLTMYHVARPCRYSKITFEVGDQFIPEKFLQLKTNQQFMELMDGILNKNSAHQERPDGYHIAVSLASFIRLITPCIKEKASFDIASEHMVFSEKAQDAILDELMEDLAFFSDDVNIEVSLSMLNNAIVLFQEAIDGVTKLYFGYSEKAESVVVSIDDKKYQYKSGMFQKAFEEEKKQRDDAAKTARVYRKKDGIIDQVFRVIRVNRDGE